MLNEKQFYNSVNLKFLKDFEDVSDDIGLINKNRRNKVLSEYKIGQLLNPIKKHQITKEIEEADVSDIMNNSIDDHLTEEAKEQYMDEREDEKQKWGADNKMWNYTR